MNPTETPPPSIAWSPNPQAATLSLPEQIAEKLGNEIISGARGPGERINEVDVAARFQVSRSPVREALRILEREGLVQINARKGTQVTELSPLEVQHIFDPRIVLNGLLARRVAERGDKAFARRFKAGVETLAAAARDADTDTYVAGVFATHRLLGTGCDNPFLVRLVFSLAHQTVRYTRLGLSTPARRRQSVRNWSRLARAIEMQDGDEAQAAAEQLARDSRDMAVKVLAEQA